MRACIDTAGYSEGGIRMTKHIPGPWKLKQGIEWPFYLEIVDSNGTEILSTPLPCHSSKDNTIEETINCVNFKTGDREKCKEMNKTTISNFHLIASAPDLLEACIQAQQWIGDELSGREDETGILQMLKQTIAKAEGRNE